MWVGELGCSPGTRYGKAFLVFEVYESHGYGDTDKMSEADVRVRVGGGCRGAEGAP